MESVSKRVGRGKRPISGKVAFRRQSSELRRCGSVPNVLNGRATVGGVACSPAKFGTILSLEASSDPFGDRGLYASANSVFLVEKYIA